jgi:lipid A ethanolaminephosphotransferase
MCQGLRMDCLRARANEPVSHDFIFHSVLGLMDVTTQAYQPALDALAPCEAPRALAPTTVRPQPAG